MTREIEALVVRGAEGMALYIDGKRVAGPKPWGGGSTIYTFKADRDAILTALSAGEGLRDALADARNALHRDRTGLAAALNAIRAEIKGREWLRPGFGWANYGYEKHTADTLREEIGWAFDAMLKILDDALRASGRIADDGVCAADSALAAPAPQEEITGTVAQMDRALTAPCGSDAGQAAVAGSSPAGSHQPAPPARDGAALIAAERQRQVTACGWTPEHDDQHKDGALAKAAACYALEGLPRALRHRRVRDGCTLDYQRDDGMISVPNLWPWAAEDWNVKNRLSNLVRAGALIAAEIDRLLRATPASAPEGDGE